MHQNYTKYNTEAPPKYHQTFTGKTCSPLLCYRFVSTTLAAQIPSGNAIANSQGLLHAETGFSYFGARYYDSDLMTGWLSVDPMADKYPSLSPYAYCLGTQLSWWIRMGERLIQLQYLKIFGTWSLQVVKHIMKNSQMFLIN